MINSLKDLQSYQEKIFEDLDNNDFNKDLLISNSDSWKKDVYKLELHHITLPLSYLKIIESFDTNNKIIDYFCISPSSKSEDNLIDELIQTQEDPFFPKEFMSKHNMYQIGSYNTDILCITNGTSQCEEGEILFVEEGYDIYNPQDDQIKKLARNFEQFLIIAGNLHQVGMEIERDNSNYEKKKQEFFKRLQILNVSPEYHDAWNYVF